MTLQDIAEILNLEQEQEQDLNPKDIDALKRLKTFDYVILNVKITCVASVLDQKVSSLTLPENTSIICILRDKKVIFPCKFKTFKENDIVFLLTKPENEIELRQLFTFICQPSQALLTKTSKN